MSLVSTERNADLSPDGRWIAYESDESGEREILVRPFPDVDDGRWQVSSDGGVWPLWNPANPQELFYLSPQGMMAVALDTEPTLTWEQPQLLFDAAEYGVPFIVGSNRRIDISPDGTRFLMFKVSSSADAPDPILVQNWTDELQRLVPTP